MNKIFFFKYAIIFTVKYELQQFTFYIKQVQFLFFSNLINGEEIRSSHFIYACQTIMFFILWNRIKNIKTHN